MRRLLSLMLGLGMLAVLATPVAAARPQRIFLEAGDFELPAGLVCEFTLRVEIVVNREYVLIFPNAADGSHRELISGRFVQRLVNVETGASMVVNVSGPAKLTVRADGSTTLQARGRSSFYRFDGEPGGPGFWVTNGPLTYSFDSSGALVHSQLPRNSLDVCAALAP